MKKIWQLRDRIANPTLIVCFLAFGFILSCERAPDSSKIVSPPAPETLKVGMLLPGPITDEG